MGDMNGFANWNFGRTHATSEEAEATLAKLTPDKRAAVEADSNEVSRFHAYMTLALWGVCCGFLHHPRANKQGKRTDGGWEGQKANAFFVSLFVGALFDFDGRSWNGFEPMQSRLLAIFNGLPGQDRTRCDWGAWVRNVREKARAENFRCSVCRDFSPLWEDDGPLAWFEQEYGRWRGGQGNMKESRRFKSYVFDLVRGLVCKMKDFEVRCAQERIVPEENGMEQALKMLERLEAGQVRVEDKIDDGLGILGRVREWIKRFLPIRGKATRGRDEVTQEEVAQKLGVSPSTVRTWERGEGSPPDGYSRVLRHSKSDFAIWAQAHADILDRRERMMDAAPSLKLGNRRGMGVKKGTK